MEERQKACLAVAACACTVLCMVSSTSAFSHGASPSACADMMPRHLRAQLHSPTNNYVTIHTNVSFYVPGDKVPVTVRSSRDFMGFLLQARKVSNDETAGTFVFIPPGSKLLSCFEDGDTVTHSDKSLKRNLSFVWKAPDQPIGDIRFFISVVQSYFVYWARIESATVAQRGHNDTSAGGSRKAGPAAPAPTQEPAGPHVADTASKGTWFVTDSFQLGVFTAYSLAQSSASTTNLYLCVTCKEDEQESNQPPFCSLTGFLVTFLLSKASTENGAALETSLPAATSWSALHIRAHLSEAAVTTAWFGNEDIVSNLSLAWRQMAESKPPQRPEEGEEVSEEVGGHTLPWVTRTGPKPAVPGRGDDSRRGTRLIAAQLGILLVCTAVLGLAAAAGLRYICARYCHKRTEVSFSEPGNNVITVKESGEMMHFRKIRENSFVLVQAEYNWISPSSSGKRRIM
ncbi:reelin domain-containing protein 1 [Phasianus colchicus]|uniref:reelin domain-containing protein 1 n=1 Tax=Phasianus colchicus TaxID=9054 RepID=UPI00129E8C83|nr:reelin domain-containing protein 1 [Phasianus colchicus]